MSDFKCSSNPFCLFHSSTILSLWLDLFQESSFPEHLSHSSSISKSWGLQGNYNITSSCSTGWDLHMIFCTPQKKVGDFSSSFLYSTLGSGWLHSTAVAVLSAHPMGLTPSICWVFLLEQGCTAFLSNTLFIVPCLSCSTWHLHAFETNTTWYLSHMTKSRSITRYNFGHLWNTASLSFQKTLTRRFHFSDAGFFFITPNFYLQLTNINCLSSPFYACL